VQNHWNGPGDGAGEDKTTPVWQSDTKIFIAVLQAHKCISGQAVCHYTLASRHMIATHCMHELHDRRGRVGAVQLIVGC
jgi:hypothetical protein